MFLTWNEKSKTLEKERTRTATGYRTPQSTTIIFSFLFLFMLNLTSQKLCQLETFPLANFFSHSVWGAGVINPTSACATYRGSFRIVCTVKYPLYCLFFYYSGYVSKSLGCRIYYFRWFQFDLDVRKMSQQPGNRVGSVSLRLQVITAE